MLNSGLMCVCRDGIGGKGSRALGSARVIKLNQDGHGNGSIGLTSMRRGSAVRHDVKVTCDYGQACEAKARVSKDAFATTSPPA